MKIAIISGSHRHNSQSEKVAHFVAKTLQKQGTEASVLSLAGNPLPLWDTGIWQNDPSWQATLKPWRDTLNDSDGLVVISPEWHGQIPSGLKNIFLLWGNGAELAHKPALIIGVSSSDGGAYPVAELRMSSYKNCRICYIPEQVIIRHVESVLNDDATKNKPDADSYFRERITWSLEVLKEYTQALRAVRASGKTRHAKFQNGM